MPSFIPLPVALALRAVRGFWRELPGPVKTLIFIGLAGAIGAMWGESHANRRCAARIEASVKAAKDRDDEIGAAQAAKAETQRVQAGLRSEADKVEIKSYVEELAKQTVAACLVGADADRYNDGLGLSDDTVQPTRAKPARRGQRHPDARSVPEGKGK